MSATTDIQIADDARGAHSLHPVVLQPFYDVGGITIYCGDNREILPTLGEYDLLLTDPPYELGEGWKRWGRDTSRRRLWTGENPEWDKLDAATLESAMLKCRQQIIWGGNLYPLPPTRSWLSWDKMQKHNGADPIDCLCEH